MRNVIFFCPHEDDELFVGGAMLVNLLRSKEYEVYVFIATNGDRYPYESKYRIRESIESLLMIGVRPQNIFFGGYGDQWTNEHIYHARDTVKSLSGHRKTYLDNPDYDEWHYIRTKKHGDYTKEDFFYDIYSFIDYIKPYAVFCVDMDAHPDHKCLSLLVDEVFRKILCEENMEPPLLLKKYAYGGMLEGIGDGFAFPAKETEQDSHTSENPFFIWEDRIRYRVPNDCNTVLMKSNLLYKVSKKYKSQRIWCNADKFINADVVYWRRNTNDLAPKARVYASSGEAKWINDYKLADTYDLSKDVKSSICYWEPDADDSERWVRFYFDDSVRVGVICIYLCGVAKNTVLGCNIVLYGKAGEIKKKQEFSCEKTGYVCWSIQLDVKYEVGCVELFFSSNGCIRIGEIEILEEDQEIPFSEFMYVEAKESEADNGRKMIRQIDGFIFKVKRFIYKHTMDYYCIRRKIWEFQSRYIEKRTI